MKLKRLLSAVLSAALLIGLCSCDLLGGRVVNGPPAVSRHVPSSSPPSGPTDSPPDETVPSTPGPEYSSEHRLNEEIPPLIDGLEMPVVGATGYTTVELPLWRNNPNGSPIPEPTQGPSTPEPYPSEEPTAEPTPRPSQFVDVPSSAEPDPTAEPVPTAEPDPTAEPVPTVEPDPTAEPVPTAEPDPTAEPADTAGSTRSVARMSASVPGPSDPYPGAVAVWGPGQAFLILAEDGDWWLVTGEGKRGWIQHRYCMINLPDVIPSMIYNDANANKSVFTAVNGKKIPGITGEALYPSMASNYRLDRQEFVMPILYSAARHICAAQHKALAEGNCLVVYQTFRPYQTQIDVAKAVSELARVDPEVKAGISTPPWSIDWFIATGVSNHQRGYALDVSMVKVYATETMYIGSRPYLRVTDFEDYQMPTAMHELSYAARSTVSPSSSQLSETMNEPAIALRRYFTSSGLSPLPSEWWHFNDNAAMQATADKPSDGRFYTSECLSQPPERVSALFGN